MSALLSDMKCLLWRSRDADLPIKGWDVIFSISWEKNRRQEWPKCRLSLAAGCYFEPWTIYTFSSRANEIRSDKVLPSICNIRKGYCWVHLPSCVELRFHTSLIVNILELLSQKLCLGRNTVMNLYAQRQTEYLVSSDGTFYHVAHRLKNVHVHLLFVHW